MEDFSLRIKINASYIIYDMSCFYDKLPYITIMLTLLNPEVTNF